MLTGIRWKRVIIAALLSEAGVIAVLLAVMATYRLVVAPDMTNAEYQTLGQRLGYYIAPTAGAITTFLVVLWVARKLESRYVANGVWVGVVSVILTSGFIFTARPEDRLMYGVAFMLRIVAGYLGGLVARRLASVGDRAPLASDPSTTEDSRRTMGRRFSRTGL